MGNCSLSCRDPAEYTYFTQALRTRIDYFILDNQLLELVDYTRTIYDHPIGPDHVPCLLQIKIPNLVREAHAPRRRLAVRKLENKHS